MSNKQILTKDYALEVKDIDVSKKEIAGYLSSFNTVDSYNDVVMPGAYTKTIRENGPGGTDQIRFLYNHKMDQPLGVFHTLNEDDFGLFYGAVLADTKSGIEVRKLLDVGYNLRHSVGYQLIKSQKSDDGVNQLKEIRLYEGSVLSTIPANWNTPMIPVVSTSVKSMAEQVDEFKSFISPYEKYASISEAEDDEIKQIEEFVQLQKSMFFSNLEAEVKGGDVVGDTADEMEEREKEARRIIDVLKKLNSKLSY